MKTPVALLLAAFALLAADEPGPDWQLRLPITVAPGAGVQRVELPASAILALQRGDGGDIRVLDADGRAQPLARLPTPTSAPRRVAIAPLPILGAADALKVTGVTLKLDDGQARVVRVDGTPQGPSTNQQLLGVLLDVRQVAGPARELALDMAAPANQPVTVLLESSDDLQNWTTEGERVLFRGGAAAPFTFPLRDAELGGRTLRVTWRTQGRALSPVSVTGATLVLAASADAARVAVPATLPPLVDRNTATFAWPLAATPAALQVALTDGATPTAVELSGRQDREQPWTEVGSGVAGASVVRSIEIDRPYREWRIVAAAGDGFEASPQVEFRFAPVAVAFLATGRPPFTLAVGRADAAPSFVSAAVLDQMAGTATGDLARATVAAAAPDPLVLLALPSGPSSRTWLLWGVLLLGVAALGAMAWTLLRQKGER